MNLTPTALPDATAFQNLSPADQRATFTTHIPIISGQLGQLNNHIIQQVPLLETPQHLQTIMHHQQQLNDINVEALGDGQLVGTFTTLHNAHQSHATIAQHYPLYQAPAHNAQHALQGSDSDHESENSTTSSMINNPATSSVSDYDYAESDDSDH